MTHVVTTFLRNRGAVLLTRRPEDATRTPGCWDGLSAPSGPGAETGASEARRLIREATDHDAFSLEHAGKPVTVTENGSEWTHYPFWFETSTRTLAESAPAESEWVSPTAMLDRETVPGLWEAYQEVALTPETIATDTSHGAAALSIRALEVLRDRAAVADEWATVAGVATALQDARPSMAVLANRINRVMSGADRTPQAVHDRTVTEIETALEADNGAAETAAEKLSGPVATLSWSGTVKRALAEIGDPVFIGEARPDFEGIDLAEALAEIGVDVTVATEAALPTLLADEPIETVLIGADTILPTGDVVNKTGTRGLALAAEAADIPVYVVTARDKVSKDDTFYPEDDDPQAVYDGEYDLTVVNPAFDLTPGELIDGVLTEDGLLDQRGIELVAAQHRSHSEWVEAVSPTQ